MPSNPKLSTTRRLAGRSRLWRAGHRVLHFLRWLPTQLTALWKNRPIIEIDNELGRFSALPLTSTVSETDPTFEAHLHSWVTAAPTGIFVDIGAGTGLYTRLAVAEGNATHAYGLEANPALYALMLKNIADNNLAAEGFNLAIGRQVGSRNLAPHSVESGNTSSCSGRSSVHVHALPLDMFLQQKEVNPKDISCIKITTNGHELAALAGMQRTLKQLPAGSRLFIRIWDDEGDPAETTRAFIKWLGFYPLDKAGNNYLFKKTTDSTHDM